MIERVVFLQPRTFAARNYMNSFGQEQTWTPWFALGLAPIARRYGIRTELLDARVTPDWLQRVGTLGPCDLLAVSVMTGNAILDALEASSRAKDVGARVVWGGPHVTLFPQDTLLEAPVDAVVPGFGAPAFEELIRSIAGARTWPYEGRTIVSAPISVPVAFGTRSVAAEASWRLALDLVDDWNRYLNSDIAIAERTINMITSEGCSRKCTYCSEPRTSGGNWLTYDVSQTVEMAADIRMRTGANGFKLHDPNFFDDLDRATTFARMFSSQIGLPWAATMHPADLARISERTLSEMASAGLRRVLVGLESPEPQLVRLAGKQYDPVLIPELVQKLAVAGIRGMFTFIVGWPGADSSHYARTIDCARRVRTIWAEHQAKIHFLEPWPGTPIFKHLVRQGFEAPTSLRDWANIDYYQARYSSIHDSTQMANIRSANQELSPYVDA